MQDLLTLSAVEMARKIRAGQLTSEAVVKACLARIEASEPSVQAWAYLDPDHALAQARELDRIRKAGRATGPLHGVPVGLKDIIDTKDMPTEQGSVIFRDRQPSEDAVIVQRLREAGAVLMGKTHTAEFAYVHPAVTTNPHNAMHTPGGSSSGSAAAVGAGHVPLAVGTQTNGSVIRPAAFCGVYGFKPTRGIISRQGLLQTSAALDQVGGFARHLEDVALLSDVLGSYDPADAASFARPRPAMLEGAQAEVPIEPNFAWFDLPFHDRLEADAREGLELVLDMLGGQVERFGASERLSDLIAVQATIHEYEIFHHLGGMFTEHHDRLSASIRPIIERARKISQTQYEDAMAVKESAEAFFQDHFNHFDAVIAPTARGQAPLMAEGHTGDPVFCTIWTLTGLPALSLPLLVGKDGLPVGVQLIGAQEEDDRLMRTASWMQAQLRANSDE